MVRRTMVRKTTTSAFWDFCEEVADIVAVRICSSEDYKKGFTSRAAQLVADNCSIIYIQWQIHKTPVQTADLVERLLGLKERIQK